MKLEALTLEQCQKVRIWRNNEMEVWRTPFMLTKEMQADFYHKRVCDRDSEHRYWAIIDEIAKYDIEKIAEKQAYCRTAPLGFIGMGGITHIQWENRIGEITLILDPKKRKDGLGVKAVDLLLNQAFNNLNLNAVFGECYCCNPADVFWKEYVEKYFGDRATTCWLYLPMRKYWKGQHWSSLYFNIFKDDFNEKHNSNK